MNNKALISFCILTLLAILFVSFLLISVGRSLTAQPEGCKIWPDDAAARLEHCSQCVLNLANEINAYCPKNNCDCMISTCNYWKQSNLCTAIHVCAGVCQDKVLFDQNCVVPIPPTAQNYQPIDYTCGDARCTIFGTGGAGAICNDDTQCTNNNCNPITHTCAFSGLFKECGSDSDCQGGLICCDQAKCIVSADINRDCKVDMKDIAFVAKRFMCKDDPEYLKACGL